jgi:hypothetical protein
MSPDSIALTGSSDPISQTAKSSTLFARVLPTYGAMISLTRACRVKEVALPPSVLDFFMNERKDEKSPCGVKDPNPESPIILCY